MLDTYVQNLPEALQIAFYEKENMNVFCTIREIPPSTRIAIYEAGGFGHRAFEVISEMRQDVDIFAL